MALLYIYIYIYTHEYRYTYIQPEDGSKRPNHLAESCKFIKYLIQICVKLYFIMCAFFWVIPRRLNFICQRFGTLYLFHLHRSMKMEQTECSEKSAYKIQTPGNYPEESI